MKIYKKLNQAGSIICAVLQIAHASKSSEFDEYMEKIMLVQSTSSGIASSTSSGTASPINSPEFNSYVANGSSNPRRLNRYSNYYFIEDEKRIEQALNAKKEFLFIRELLDDYENIPQRNITPCPKSVFASADLSLFIYEVDKELKQKNRIEKEENYPVVNCDYYLPRDSKKLKYAKKEDMDQIAYSCTKIVEYLGKLLSIVLYDLFQRENRERDILPNELSSSRFHRFIARIFRRDSRIYKIQSQSIRNLKQFKSSLKKKKMYIQKLQDEGLVPQEIIDKILGNITDFDNLKNILDSLRDEVKESDFKKEMSQLSARKYDTKDIKHDFELTDRLTRFLEPIFTDSGYAFKIIAILESQGLYDENIEILRKITDKYSYPEKKEEAMSKLDMTLKNSKKSIILVSIVKDLFIEYGCIKNLKEDIQSRFSNVDDPKDIEDLLDLFGNLYYFEQFKSAFIDGYKTEHFLYRNNVDYDTVSDIYNLINAVKRIKTYFSNIKAHKEVWNYPLLVKNTPRKCRNRWNIIVNYRDVSGLMKMLKLPATQENLRLLISMRRISEIVSLSAGSEDYNPDLVISYRRFK